MVLTCPSMVVGLRGKMTAQPIIAFRCDASARIGTGHVMRCLTLATALKHSHQITFLCTEETLESVPVLRESGFRISHADTLDHADWLIVDHYGLDKSFETSAREWADNILVIDDLADRDHDCDVLVDQTRGRKAGDYKKLVPSHCNILTGTDFALLKNEYAQLRASLSRTFENPKNILVSFGGVNPKNATEFTLRALSAFNDFPLSIDVVTGAHAGGLDEIKKLCEEINGGMHTAELYVNTPEMPRLMAKADMCIGAGGTTSWERCFLKLPSLALELADNQTFVLKQLDEAGAIKNLGRIEDLDQQTFVEEFSKLLKSASELQTMSDKAAAIVNGKGTERLKCFLLRPEKAKDDAPVILRPMLEEHCKLLFDWQQIPEVRKFARNKEPPKWEEHQGWFENTLHNVNRHLYFIEYSGQPAGMLRLDENMQNTYEVSILVDPQYHGMGLASAALSLARQLLPNALFKAEVLEANEASHKLFQKAGYKAIDDTWYEQTAAQG